MKIRVQSIRFDADSKLLDFIQGKVDKLDSYYDQVIDGDVFLKLDRAEDSANKIVEIKLNIPGNSLFVKEQRQSFEEATDVAMDSMTKQIKKHKEKQREHAGKAKTPIVEEEV
jgi:putative sigma-54 modulation protein